MSIGITYEMMFNTTVTKASKVEVDFILPYVMIGHFHLARTAWPEIISELAVWFEWVFGHDVQLTATNAISSNQLVKKKNGRSWWLEFTANRRFGFEIL
jgi:hypothetical protein